MALNVAAGSDPGRCVGDGRQRYRSIWMATGVMPIEFTSTRSTSIVDCAPDDRPSVSASADGYPLYERHILLSIVCCVAEHMLVES
jgi:hypothetical protein